MIEISGGGKGLVCDTAAEGKKLFDTLAEGGRVTMPFEKQMWSDVFGMCVDRFGIAWMVNITQG